MKVFALIPARYQSTCFPGKPMPLVAGKSMIQHVYACAILCPELSGAYVATDNDCWPAGSFSEKLPQNIIKRLVLAFLLPITCECFLNN